MSRTVAPLALALSALLAVAGCGLGSDAPAAPAAVPLPESFWSPTEPSGAVPVSVVKKSAKTGDEVVLIGRAGGEKKTFSEGLASFFVVDATIPACGEKGVPDDCKTPWDYCCEDKTELRAAMATVEFRDGGKVLRSAPRGFHGLDHLKTVVVAGKAERDDAGNLTVVASRIFVRP